MHLKLYDYTGFDFDGATTTVDDLGFSYNFGIGNFATAGRTSVLLNAGAT